MFYKNEQAEYRKRYELYGEQVQFLNRQIAAFIDGLRATGQYDSASIIIHGDHGSRLQLLNVDREERAKARNATLGADIEEEFVSGSDEQDLSNLLSKFATLLAIKLPGAAAPEIVNEKGSVLYFLRQTFSPANEPVEAGINSVYVSAGKGPPKGISLIPLWQTADNVRRNTNGG